MNRDDALYLRWQHDGPAPESFIGTTAALLLGAMAASTAGSALAAHKKTTTNQTSTQTQTFDPIAQLARQQAGTAITKNLSNPLSLDPGLLSQGLTGINQSFNSAIPQMQDMFSSRGLGQSGLFGGSLNNVALGRLGQIGQLYQQVLGTADARNRANIQQAMQLGQPTGSTGTGTSVSTGPGAVSGLGSGLENIGGLLSLMSALRSSGFGGGNTGSVPTANTDILSQLGLGGGAVLQAPDVNTGAFSGSLGH